MGERGISNTKPQWIPFEEHLTAHNPQQHAVIKAVRFRQLCEMRSNNGASSLSTIIGPPVKLHNN